MESIYSDLIEATLAQNLESVKELFKKSKKSSLQFTNNTGKTLLHLASLQKNEKTLPLIQYLLESGVDPLSVDENFETAFDIAKKNNNIPACSIIKHHINKQNQELQDSVR